MCENSPSTEVDERNPPTSLDDHPTHAHTAALNAARTANAELLRDLQQLLASHAKVLEVLDVLVDECGTNADFADEHDSEVEALGRAETASSTARTLQQQLAARVAA
ncbi:MAG: hypothetical protein A2579_12320 [Lysobacterales bacterium RIFOXYD1_FULL_69_11]|nr:MAG: hypothetical protein A2579_12320 [Xanthomonadales bacterium RIFOXYD1_FULL_69_11]